MPSDQEVIAQVLAGQTDSYAVLVSRYERLARAALQPTGFEPDEAMLPAMPQSFDGYRLLQEYYALPERFLFFTLEGLDRASIRCARPSLSSIRRSPCSEPLEPKPPPARNGKRARRWSVQIRL